jgi:hypothetical protein
MWSCCSSLMHSTIISNNSPSTCMQPVRACTCQPAQPADWPLHHTQFTYLTVLSQDPVASTWVVGLKAIQHTGPEWPARISSSLPVFSDHTYTWKESTVPAATTCEGHAVQKSTTVARHLGKIVYNQYSEGDMQKAHAAGCKVGVCVSCNASTPHQGVRVTCDASSGCDDRGSLSSLLVISM